MFNHVSNQTPKNIMMKKFISLLMLCAAVTACQDAPVEEPTFDKQTVTFCATPSETTRTYLLGNNTYWDANDQIGGFAQGNNNVLFSTIEGRNGYFTGEISGNPDMFYLYYPYQSDATFSGTTLSASLPAEQKLVDGSTHDVLPMVATATDFDELIVFENLCGIVKLNVKSNIDRTLTSLKFEAADTKAAVCGSYSVDMSNPESPVMTMMGDGAAAVTLVGEVPLTAETVHTFYVALPPVTYAGGFVVTLTDADGNQMVTSDDPDKYKFTSDLPMAASRMVNVGTTIEFVTETVVGESVVELTALAAATPAVTFTIDQDNLSAMATKTGYTPASATKLTLEYKALSNGEAVEPTITINGEAYSSSATYDLTMPAEIVLSYGDMTKTYTAKLSQLTDTGLPVVYVRTPSEITSKDIWTPTSDEVSDEEFCQMYIDADGRKSWDGVAFEDFAEFNCQVKGRGNSTWGWDKNPYAIKLAKKKPVLGMPKHKRWVLLANLADKSMIRNSVAFMIAKACYNDGTGVQQGWNPSGHCVELVLNDKHVGNYLLCEQIKIDENRINIAESDTPTTSTSDQGYLLECDRYWGSDDNELLYWTSYRQNTSYKQCYNSDYTYMYGTNYYDGGVQVAYGNYKMKFGLKSPDDGDLGENGTGKSTAAYEFISTKVTDTEKWIFDTMTTSTSLSEIAKYIHVDSYIDYWLTFEVAMNQEPNNPGSVYMYYDPSDGLLHAGPIWDFDLGTYRYDFNDSGLYYNKSTHFIIANSIWYCKLLQNTAFQNRVIERWAIIKPLLETMVEQIPTLTSYLATSAEYNWTMWNYQLEEIGLGEESESFNSVANTVYSNTKSRINDLNTLITNKRYK